MPKTRLHEDKADQLRQVPLLDLKKQYQSIKGDIKQVLEKIYEDQYFILGPEVEKLEKLISDYCQTPFAVGVSSGTDALLLSLMTGGVGRDDLVLTTPYTFFATAGSIVRCGASPVFVDIEPDTYNMDPVALEKTIESLPSGKRKCLKAIIPVHLYGQCADMDPIYDIAGKHGLLLIEDAAQAIGAEYKGKRAGSIGDFGCFSFFPSKNLGAFGDGGVVTLSDGKYFERMKMLRVHGGRTKYHHDMVGGNFRLDAIQAAVVAVKLKYLDQWTSARQRNADRYRSLFREYELDSFISLPTQKQARHIYNQFVIAVEDQRNKLKQYLLENQIGVEVYYPVPLHLQPCFANLGYREGDFPVAEKAAESTLALPIYPELTADQQEYVVRKIKRFFS